MPARLTRIAPLRLRRRPSQPEEPGGAPREGMDFGGAKIEAVTLGWR
jgi:hypothetical protein